MVVSAPWSPLYAAPRCENDAGGRFTLWPAPDAHLRSCLSCGAALACGQTVRPPGAARAARAVAGATPSPKAWCGLGPSVFSQLASASKGRSSTSDPSGEGSSAASTRQSNQSSIGGQRCPNGLHRLPCPRADAESAGHGHPGSDAAIRVCHYAAPSVRVSPPVHGGRRSFEAVIQSLADRPMSEPSGHPCERLLAFLQRND